jgi:hypothetical protein
MLDDQFVVVGYENGEMVIKDSDCNPNVLLKRYGTMSYVS